MRSLVLCMLLGSSASIAFSQHSVQVDDGFGRVALIMAPTTGATGIFSYTLPPGGGSLIVTGSGPSSAWLLGGNTLSALGSSPTQWIGSSTNDDVVMKANSVEKVRLVSGGGVKVSMTPASTSTELVVSNSGVLQTRSVSSLSLLTTTLTSARIWVGDGTNIATERAPGGDVSMTNTGNFSVNSVQTGAGTSIAAAINSNNTNDINGDNVKIDGTLGVTSNNLGINLSNPNTWTGTQTFGSHAFTPSAPAALAAGTTHNWAAPGTVNSYYRITASGAATLTGITGGTAGRIIVLSNVGSNAITLKHQTGSTGINQFDLPGGGDIILGARGAITLIYDGTLGFWEVASTN